MNKISLLNQLKALEQQYPKPLNDNNITDLESYNMRNHANKIYKLTCAIVDLWFSHLITKKIAKHWGSILRQYEYYFDEAGLTHFNVFNGI